MPLIVIAAGGTGGHVFPAEALAGRLTERGLRVAVMTDGRSATAFDGRERHVIRGAGIAGRGAWRAARAVAAMAAGIVQARAILARMDVAVMVGFGGYPSVAPVLAARLLRKRPGIVLHEQNAVLGRANRFLASRADALALSFADTARVPQRAKTTITGNPVRAPIGAIAPYAPPDATLRLLVLGGSLGARVFSDVVPQALAPFAGRVSVVQQCRAEDLDRVRTAYAASGVEAELAAFFPDIAGRLARAHLVIARAGASTVAELAVCGRPALLVPLPGAIDDHQSANAQALAATGAAWVMPQTAFTPAALAARIVALLDDPPRLAAASRRRDADATDRLADLVEALSRERAPA